MFCRTFFIPETVIGPGDAVVTELWSLFSKGLLSSGREKQRNLICVSGIISAICTGCYGCTDSLYTFSLSLDGGVRSQQGQV